MERHEESKTAVEIDRSPLDEPDPDEDEPAVPTDLGPRSLARWYAFQALYQLGVTHEPVKRSLELLWATDGATADTLVRRFATQLATLTMKHLDKIDRLIEQYAQQRALHRIPMVDLAILRLGCAELLYLSDVPPAVTIDEMIEIAKRFSTGDSPAFVNAVLDRIRAHRDEVPASEKDESRWVSTEG